MLPCPFPRELPLYVIRQGSAVWCPTGRPPVRVVTTRDPVPEPRRSAPRVKPLVADDLGLLETPPTRALSLGLTSRRKISDPSVPRSAARSPSCDATHASQLLAERP